MRDFFEPDLDEFKRKMDTGFNFSENLRNLCYNTVRGDGRPPPKNKDEVKARMRASVLRTKQKQRASRTRP